MPNTKESINFFSLTLMDRTCTYLPNSTNVGTYVIESERKILDICHEFIASHILLHPDYNKIFHLGIIRNILYYFLKMTTIYIWFNT